jgi:hypothetical protein
MAEVINPEFAKALEKLPSHLQSILREQSDRLPPILDVPEAGKVVSCARTGLYALDVAGEIQSLTVGAPGKRGKRVYLTASLLAYLARRLVASPKIKKKADGVEHADQAAVAA